MKNMRMVILTGSMLAAACGDDQAPPDSGGPPDGAPIDSVSFDSVPGESPVISQVSWTTPAACEMFTASGYTFTIDVTDADTVAGDLTYSGSVAGCTGVINANPATITCPNAAPYGGGVTVTDPEGHSDAQTFSIMPCIDGSAP